jgi:hypothetical protein
VTLTPLQADILIAIIIGGVSGIVGYYVSKYVREPVRLGMKGSLT